MKTLGAQIRLNENAPPELLKHSAANDGIFGHIDAQKKPGVYRIRLVRGIDGLSYIMGPNQHYIDLPEEAFEEI